MELKKMKSCLDFWGGIVAKTIKRRYEMKNVLIGLIAVGFLYGGEITIADSNPAKDVKNAIVKLEKKIEREKKRFNKIENELKNIAKYLKGYEKFLGDKEQVIEKIAKLEAQCRINKNNYLQQNMIGTEEAQNSINKCEKDVENFIKIKESIWRETEKVKQNIEKLHNKGVVDRNELQTIKVKIDLLKSLLNLEKDKKELGGLK